MCGVCRAEALQSLLQLLGEKDLYDYYRDTYKVHGVDWTVGKARQVLDSWRRKFTQVRLLREVVDQWFPAREEFALNGQFQSFGDSWGHRLADST